MIIIVNSEERSLFKGEYILQIREKLEKNEEKEDILMKLYNKAKRRINLLMNEEENHYIGIPEITQNFATLTLYKVDKEEFNKLKKYEVKINKNLSKITNKTTNKTINKKRKTKRKENNEIIIEKQEVLAELHIPIIGNQENTLNFAKQRVKELLEEMKIPKTIKLSTIVNVIGPIMIVKVLISERDLKMITNDISEIDEKDKELIALKSMEIDELEELMNSYLDKAIELKRLTEHLDNETYKKRVQELFENARKIANRIKYLRSEFII